MITTGKLNLLIFTKLLSNSFAVVFPLWTTENNEVSSAYNFAFEDRLLARSFIHIKNSSGPSIEPWGTLALTSAQEEVYPSSTTLSFLFLRKLDNRF